MPGTSRDKETALPSLENSHAETTPLLHGQVPATASNGTQTGGHFIDQQNGSLAAAQLETS